MVQAFSGTITILGDESSMYECFHPWSNEMYMANITSIVLTKTQEAWMIKKVRTETAWSNF